MNNGQPLDDNLILVEMFKQDETFNANLTAGIFVLPGAMIIPTSGQTVADTLTNWKGNSNGFKLGSASSKYGPQTNGTRTLTNCITFNNFKKGFDQNNGGDTSYITNGISFNNNQNYQLNLNKLPVFVNNKSFNGVSSDKLPAGASVIKITDPVVKQAIIDEVTSKCALIKSMVNSDQIPMDVTFNCW
ncbi:MAG TPA: hypothetical protein VHY08_02890 [Bacillota bacterium]|nr:hypothetical protein [Bacillota bacterium]